MIGSKVITAIAYAVIGSEVVKDNLTIENARKVGNAISRAATTTGKVARSRASSLKSAVSRRKDEILSAKSDGSPF